MYEKIKYFKENVKLMRIYESQIDSDKSFSCFIKLKKIISDQPEFEQIICLKEDLDWFKNSEEKFYKSFREKFHEAIKSNVLNITLYISY